MASKNHNLISSVFLFPSHRTTIAIQPTTSRAMAGMLLHKRLRTFDSAADDEGGFLLAIQHQRAAEGSRQQIGSETESIVAVVRHHLRLRHDDNCIVLPPDSWIQGGFNLCVHVDVQSRGLTEFRRVVFRCPVPHQLAEQQHPGIIGLASGHSMAGSFSLRTILSPSSAPTET
jgi:hypothetical protein